MKKVISVFLVLILALSAVPLASAYSTFGDYGYDVLDNGSVKLMDFYGMQSDVIFPVHLGKYMVSSIDRNLFLPNDRIYSITIPKSITDVDMGAFCYCEALEKITVDPGNPNYSSVDGVLFNKDKTEILCFPPAKKTENYKIPSTVTKIGLDAFAFCGKLKNITIPESVTSIDYSAFCYCTSLLTIKLPDSLQELGENVFESCTALQSANIPSGLTKLNRWTFMNCSALSEIIIPNSVTSIDMLNFLNCVSLHSAFIPDSVTAIDMSAFAGCPNLTIYGKSGSYAESYAKNYEIPFSPLNFIVGDVNGDGKINLHDEFLMQQYVNEKAELTSLQVLAGDLNGDGKVNLRDCYALQKQISA